MATTDRVDADQGVSTGGPPCSMGKLLTELHDTDPAEAQGLERMLHDGWPPSAIYAEVVKAGHYVAPRTIGYHRSEFCRCYRGGRR